MVKIPIEVDIPISITSEVIDGIMMVGIASLSNVDLSKLTWSISDVKPQRITSLNNGTLLIMSFRLYDVGKYNLVSGSIQMDFIGSDIFDYLQTSDSNFGTIIRPRESSFVPTFAVMGLLATLAAGFAMGKSLSADNDDD